MRIRQFKYERKKKHTVGTFVCLGKNCFPHGNKIFSGRKCFLLNIKIFKWKGSPLCMMTGNRKPEEDKLQYHLMKEERLN